VPPERGGGGEGGRRCGVAWRKRKREI